MSSRVPARAPRLFAALLFSIAFSPTGIGCSSEGAGTVNVKSPDKVQESLSKGSPPVASKGPTDDMGAKFRKRGGN